MVEALLTLFNHHFGEIDCVDRGRWIPCGDFFGEQTGSGADIEDTMRGCCGLVQAMPQSVRAGELRVDRRLMLRLKIVCSFFPRIQKIENIDGNCKRNHCVAAGVL